MGNTCEECGKVISNRARANIWRGEHVVCTPCLGSLKAAIAFEANKIGHLGRDDARWLVDDGAAKLGPYTTGDLIERLRGGQAKWEFLIWRDGMTEWKKAARLFTIPELSPDGRLRLREFDGPPRPRLI